MLDWDDLRYVLMVGRHRTLSKAGAKLGVNHSTVFRRIRRAETVLATRLFVKQHDGYTPTSAGDDILALAERFAAEAASVEARLALRDARPSGLIRVTTTDALWLTVIMPAVKAFREAYPDIVLEFVISNDFVNLSKRHADIAIRPASNPPTTLLGRKISDLAFAIYGSCDYLAAHECAAVPGAYQLVVPDESLTYIASEPWLRRKLPAAEVHLKLNSVFGLFGAARIGLGVAALPCYLGDSAPELRRIAVATDDLTSELWLLTHRDLRDVARIKAFMSFMGKTLGAKAKLFGGRSARNAAS